MGSSRQPPPRPAPHSPDHFGRGFLVLNWSYQEGDIVSKQEFHAYSEQYQEWVNLSEEDLAYRFNNVPPAQNPSIVSKVLVQDRYLNELARRESARREARIVDLTGQMHQVTRRIEVLTVFNVLLVAITVIMAML